MEGENALTVFIRFARPDGFDTLAYVSPVRELRIPLLTRSSMELEIKRVELEKHGRKAQPPEARTRTRKYS